MAKNKTIYLTGTTQWAKFITPDTKYGSKFSVDLYLDPESWVIWNENNIGKKIYKNDEGEEYVKLVRDEFKLFGEEKVVFGPPPVFDKDGHRTYDLVGNGSRIQAKVTVFPTANGSSCRLEAVKILDLVTFVPTSKDMDEWDGPPAF